MKLYYSPGACSLADHIALAEAGLPYDLVQVDLKAKRTEDGRDYAAINPKGYVPALELDEGGVLTENIAVLSYISARADGLMPAEGMPRWRALEAMAFVSTELHKNFKPFFNPAASDADKEEAAKMLARRFATAADMLDGRDFIVGDALTPADCYLFVMLMWARKNKIEISETLVDYADRLKQRPAFAKALGEEGLA